MNDLAVDVFNEVHAAVAIESRTHSRGDQEQLLDGARRITRQNQILLLPQLWGKPSGGLPIEMADSVRMATFPHEHVSSGH